MYVINYLIIAFNTIILLLTKLLYVKYMLMKYALSRNHKIHQKYKKKVFDNHFAGALKLTAKVLYNYAQLNPNYRSIVHTNYTKHHIQFNARCALF